MSDPTTTTVYGCSDDLIEMDGAIYDEISRYDAPTLVEFNNSVRLRVEYDRDRDGIWRIEDQSKLDREQHARALAEVEERARARWESSIAAQDRLRDIGARVLAAHRARRKTVRVADLLDGLEGLS